MKTKGRIEMKEMKTNEESIEEPRYWKKTKEDKINIQIS